MGLTSEQLLNILTYDSEEYKILTLEQRCQIHKERARQESGYPPQDFSNEQLQELVIRTYTYLKQIDWKRPVVIYYKDEDENIQKKTQDK